MNQSELLNIRQSVIFLYELNLISDSEKLRIIRELDNIMKESIK